MTDRPTRAVTSDPRYYDFDAAFGEGKPIPFKVMGKVYQLPPTVPAATILNIQRLMLVVAKLEAGGDVPDDLVIDDDLSYESMCRQLAGDDVVDAWLEAGISYDMLAAVTRRLYAIHTGQPVDDVEPGKAPKKPADRKPRKAAKKASPRRR